MVKFICVHGNIGAGKSTFIQNISSMHPDNKYICLEEPIDKWGVYLQKYYNALEILQKTSPEEIKNPTNIQTLKAQQDIIAFEIIITNIRLQQYVQISHLRNNQPKYAYLTHNQQPSELIKETIYVFERSIEESWVIFCQTLQQYLTSEQWDTLKYFFEIAIQQEIAFDEEIYLQAPTEELTRRINKRGRKEETNITFEYLDALNEAYKKYQLKHANEWTYL